MTTSKKLRKLQHFTILEILLAVAILLILMGLLMKFATSAQGLWAASHKQAATFEGANLAFELMEQDIENMIVRSQEQNPDGMVPFFFDDTSPNQVLAMTTCQDGKAAFVIYKYDNNNKTLTRYYQEITTELASDFNKNGFDTTLPSNFSSYMSSTNGEIILEQLESFSFMLDKETSKKLSDKYAVTAPKAIKVVMTLKNNSGHLKDFSQVFYPNLTALL